MEKTVVVSWRDSAIIPTLFGVDARVTVPALFIYGLHFSWTTFYIAVTGLFISWVMLMFNISLENAYRIVRRFLFGPIRPAAVRKAYPIRWMDHV